MSVSTDNASGAAPRPASWRWSTWSLTRKLPVLTGAIVVLVVAVLLLLTYNALVSTRLQAMHDRLKQIVEQVVQNSEQSTRNRLATYQRAAANPTLVAALRAAEQAPVVNDSAPVMRAAAQHLLTLRTAPDSSLPIELWSADGRRIVHVGTDVRDDPMSGLRPELRTRSGKPVTEVPSTEAGLDSARFGAFYASNGRVLFWTVAPVFDGRQRIGYLAQQRLYRSTPQTVELVRKLIGNGASLYLHNTTDDFWSSYLGAPVAPLTGLDTARGDFVGTRDSVGDVTVYDQAVPHTPWAITLEAPVNTVLAEPRRIVRQLLLISAIIAFMGLLAVWAVSRRITRPIVSLAHGADALARGDYAARVAPVSEAHTDDEVSRLALTFNRMAEEIQSSHQELEQQVDEALAVSAELEETNEQLQELSMDAEAARDEAQQANRAKSDFLAVMSHELRTPLNAIGGYTEIMQLGIYGPVSERQKEALERIARSQQMLLSLINDVLNFAKLDAGQVQYRMSDVSLAEALAPVESLLAPQLEGKEQRYRFDCVSDAVVRADRDKLQQIALNLLSNAIKFTPEGGTITLSCHADGEYGVVEVADTGVGIAPERLDSVFDPFVQVDRALNRPHEGVGLGLAISRDLAQGMGGSLTVSSTPGTGSVFTLKLRKADAARSA
ncbi:MAG TPA: HAMP domain-containing sensor histidine kinase [Gemmatimonadaceae bacterium]|nr:HAMP domain-containing sensor histidine kinase [Gemmatimonadaceae bacterium]